MNDALIRDAASAYEEMMSPFDGDWLAEHNVTLDDCFALANLIATLLRGYVSLPPTARTKLLFRGAASAVGLPDAIIDHTLAQTRMGELARDIASVVTDLDGSTRDRRPTDA